MQRFITLLFLLVVGMGGQSVILTGARQAPPCASDTREADAKAIRDMDAQRDWAAKDVDKMAAYYADDASSFVPRRPVLAGKEAIRNFLKESMAVRDPNLSESIAATKLEVSRAGDLAYTQGTYTATGTDPATKKVVTMKGKYVTVFKKQPDGSWKAVADIFNADGPPTVAK